MHTKVLIDCSNAWYRSYIVGTTHMEAPGGPVSIMTYMLRRTCRKYGKNNVIVCLDRGRSGRDVLDKGYKAKRITAPGVWDDLNWMLQIMESLGIKVAHCEGYEADDVIGSLANQLDSDVLIESYDKDFYQLVTDRIKVIRPERTIKGNHIPEKIVERSDVIEEFGCGPEHVIILRAFKGDKSDNIPKVPIRFTKKFQKDFFKVLFQCKNIKDFYSKIDRFNKKYQADLLAFKDRAILNEKLVAIYTNLDVLVEQSKLNADRFEALCDEMRITRLKVADWQSMLLNPAPPPPVQGTLF